MAMPNGRLSPWGWRRLQALNRRPPPPIGVGRRLRRRVGAGRAVAVQNVPRFPFHFADQPNRKFCKLKYVSQLYDSGPAANAIIVKEFRANGMYDPDYTGVGHQPYGFDQLMTQYNHYTVLKCTCRVSMNLGTTYTNMLAFVSCYNEHGIITDAYNAGGINGMRELPLNSKDVQITTGDTKEQNRSQVLVADIAKIFGKSPWNLIGDSNFQGDAAHDPTEDIYFGVCVYTPTLVDLSAQKYSLLVHLTYYCCFTEPKWFTTS